MTEATLKGALVKTLREVLDGFTILRHEDRFTSGIPDLSVSGMGRTSWYEVKFANPGFEMKGIQDLTLSRLSENGSAHYIIYAKLPQGHFTYFTKPSEINDWKLSRRTPGFDHRWLAGQILAVHKT